MHCPECGFPVDEQRLLSVYVQTQCMIKIFKCLKCQENFTNKTAVTLFGCNLCELKFADERSMMAHMQANDCNQKVEPKKKENWKKLVQCLECCKTYSCAKSLTKHVAMTHRGERKFRCLDCGFWFKQKIHLIRHVSNLCKFSFFVFRNLFWFGIECTRL